MIIGIIGTGDVAQTLASRWRSAGHTVVLGSRDPDTAAGTRPVVDVVREAAVVVNATPGSASVEALSAVVDPAAFAGKVLIDVSNAVTDTFALAYPNDSVGARLQEALPDAKVVKTLSTAAMSLLTDPAAAPPISVFLSGDDADAKRTVTGLLRDLGWTDDAIVDLGGIVTARGPESYFLLHAALMSVMDRPFAIRVVSA